MKPKPETETKPDSVVGCHAPTCSLPINGVAKSQYISMGEIFPHNPSNKLVRCPERDLPVFDLECWTNNFGTFWVAKKTFSDDVKKQIQEILANTKGHAPLTGSAADKQDEEVQS